MDVIAVGNPRVPSFTEWQSTRNTLRSYKLTAAYFFLSLEPSKAGTGHVLNIYERGRGERTRKEKLGRVRSRPFHLTGNFYRCNT